MIVLLGKYTPIQEGLKALAQCRVGAFLDIDGLAIYRDLIRQRLIGIEFSGIFPYSLNYQTIQMYKGIGFRLVNVPPILPMHIRIPEIIEEIVDILKRHSFHGYVYLVGGYVRDSLIRQHTEDLDLSVYGDFVQFTQIVKSYFPVVSLPLGVKIQISNYNLDITYSRYDFYTKPGKMPVVIPANISEDLERRDFTIGAMAYMVYPYQGFIDPFDGLGDLRSSILRYIRLYAPYEDPSRVLRGIRYAEKLSLKWESASYFHSKEALKNKTNMIISRRYFRELATLIKTVGIDKFWILEKEWNILKYLTCPYHDIILRYINYISSYEDLKLLIMLAYKKSGITAGYSVLGMNKAEITLFKRCSETDNFMECVKEGGI